jgi:hypothetical protein
MTFPWDRVRDRYANDAPFRRVVDMLQAIVLDLHLTPSEVREAAMLACILVEERHKPAFKISLPYACSICGAGLFPMRFDEKEFAAFGACGHRIPLETLIEVPQ